MILKALKYTRYKGIPREWSIVGNSNDYAYFGNINLLVGKNASGKSRTLNVIREIANLLSGKVSLEQTISPTESYELLFSKEDGEYRYILCFKDRIVSDEILYYNKKLLLDRKKEILNDGDGKNVFSLINQSELYITSSSNGNFYFKDLVLWGKSLRNYLFANQMEKNRYVKDYTQIEEEDAEIGDTDVLIYTFHKGRELFGDSFVTEIIDCMSVLDYDITKIDIQHTKKGYGLLIEEEGEYTVSQREMSQGMFRALSLFIMLIYARLNKVSFCLLIDDIGEGLDFDSSKRLIDIVIKKVNKSDMQFFMTSNDRNIMNQIPLRYWSVIEREHNKSVFYDYKNSKDTFDDFKYTGLNNFDFIATNFFSKGFGVMEEDDE